MPCPFSLTVKRFPVNNLTLYEYVASNNPEQARAIANNYGYNIPAGANWMDIAKCLNELVISDGAQPLHQILSIHPDREILSESFSFTGNSTPAAVTTDAAASAKKCSCEKNAVDKFLGINTTGMHLQQGNLLLIGGILILAVAIIATHK